MTKIKDGGSAFPTITKLRGHSLSAPDYYADVAGGMTLRDWFAGQALAGMLAGAPFECEPTDYVDDAYRYADTMLNRRKVGAS